MEEVVADFAGDPVRGFEGFEGRLKVSGFGFEDFVAAGSVTVELDFAVGALNGHEAGSPRKGPRSGGEPLGQG